MATLTGPLMSLAASGTLNPAYAIRHRGLIHILELARGHPTGPNQALRTKQLLAAALTEEWHRLTNTERLTWSGAIPAFGPTRYHAYMRYNLSRKGHYPELSAVWPYAPVALSSGPTFTAPIGGPRIITYTIYPYGLPSVWLAVAYRTQFPWPPLTALAETAYWPMIAAGARKYHETQIPPGNWPVYYNVISRTGWRYTAKYGGVITVTD